MKNEFQSTCQSCYLPSQGQRDPFSWSAKLIAINHACICLPLFGINRRWWRRISAGRWRRRCAGWRRSVTRWWRRDSSSIGPHDTRDLIPLRIHTLHVGIVISPLECPIVCIWVRSSLLASPLPANHVIGLEYFKGLRRARPYHDTWACGNRCAGA
jgi:hypothetical protein